MESVSENTVVAIRFSMTNSRGEILENIMEGPSIHYLHGSGHILPALEAQLIGLIAGDQKKIFISKDHGYEGVDDDFIVEVVIDDVRQATQEELLKGISARDNPGESCGPDCIC